jgi:histidinol-phosphatase
MDNPTHWQLRAVAMAAAEAGGQAAIAHFRRPGLAVEWKHDDSPVTRADREAEAAIRAVVRAAFPDDAWLGEETGESGGGSGRRWIVDPIDGTRNFVRGVPLWATLVACEEDGPEGPQVVASAVLIPAQGERYDAVRGGGARLNGVPIAVSHIARLEQALFCYEAPSWFVRHQLKGVFDDLCSRCGLARGLGDAYGHMLVASGRAEVMVEPQLSVWDVAATSLIIEEAGGRFSALNGTATIRAGNAVVSNGRLHDEVLRIIADKRPD